MHCRFSHARYKDVSTKSILYICRLAKWQSTNQAIPRYWSLSIPSGNINPLSANFTKWSNTLNKFVGKLTANCLSVFDHFVGLALKGLRSIDRDQWHELSHDITLDV